jgi:hypothetical protein
VRLLAKAYGLVERWLCIKEQPEMTPLNKRFDLNTPRDLLQKLAWEIEQQSKSHFSSPEEEAYRAWNCAVTAWQISDWVWQALDDAGRELVRSKSPKPKAEGATPLQTLVMAECREIAICRQLATGSKHFVIDRHDDPEVSSRREPGFHVLWNEKDESFLHVPGIMHFIYDGEKPYAPIALFRRAYEYWDGFLGRFSL